ncbi:Small mechanosensitive channel family, partial [Globisporangium splendens]
MIALWRFGVAGVLAVLAYFLSKPVMEALLAMLRARIGKGFQWIADVQRYMLLYLSWICFALLLILIANNVLQLDDTANDAVSKALYYFLAAPVVLGTFALRKVVSNLIIRYLEWDRGSTDYDAKILVVTEGVTFLCFVLIVVEIFYIFFVSNEMASFLLVEVLVCLEVIALCAGFTTLKNVATGLFLIFAEPFRTGSWCRLQQLCGFIEKVSLARTTLRRYDGALVFIPNGIFADVHQTNGNAQDAQLHELVLQVHPATPIDKIHQLVDELTTVVPQYAIPEDYPMNTQSHTTFTRGSVEDSMATPPSTTQYAYENRSFASNNTEYMQRHYTLSGAESTTTYRVVLQAMYRVKVMVLVDRMRFPSLETAKTEQHAHDT